MSKKEKVIVAVVLLTLMMFAFDLHMYIFDRPSYLIKKASNIYVEAQVDYKDYRACRKSGYKDHRCNYLKASYLEKMGEYDQIQALLYAEAVRNRK